MQPLLLFSSLSNKKGSGWKRTINTESEFSYLIILYKKRVRVHGKNNNNKKP